MTPSLPRLLDLPSSYQVLAVAANRQQVAITLASIASSAPCPFCGTRSSRLHRNYQRTVADLPCAGRRIVFSLHPPKWRCLNPARARQVFAERLDPFIRVFARLTTRLSQALECIGLVTNAEGGTRLAKHLGMTASPAALLRRIMALSEPASPPPKKIGLDEWAYRRGRRYGTIIVDLERHRVVDLLADGEVDTVVAWLEQHPTIELVSRDRSREFARAIAQGAPQAIQVLDRWHLLKNLTEILPPILGRCFTELRRSLQREPETPPTEPARVIPFQPLSTWKAAPSRQAEARRLARQEERNARYAQVRGLGDLGWTSEESADHLQMNARTVRHWLRSFRTDTRYRKRAHPFDRLAPYVWQRWQEGCQKGTLHWEELVAQGDSGSLKSVYQFLRPLRHGFQPGSVRQDGASPVHSSSRGNRPLPPRSPLDRYTLTQVQWLFVRDPEDLTTAEREHLTWLCDQYQTLSTLYALVQAFRGRVKARRGSELDAWAQDCERSGIRELKRFALHLRSDWDPAVAGLTLPESQGQTEGQVHKLKLLKRQMSGRAGFALLRKRVLLAV